jgi:peptidoglycan/xylan/chitin deacetylase (PgdA/CDA1 family)
MTLINYALFTNDVEDTSIWLNTLRDETAFKVYHEGLPILLEIYDELNIKSTFFFTGYIARLIPDIVKMVVKYGHEVGSHGKSHLRENGFDVMPLEKQIRHLEETKKLLEDISGIEVISFRAPALRVNDDTPKALISTGYKIDSSVASQRFDFFLSFGSFRKLKWFTSPRKPYYTDPNSLFRKGSGPLIEIPLSALFFPYVGTTMRLFPNLTKIQRKFIHFETSITKKPVVFDIHPNEFIDESNELRTINNRTNNFILYMFQDWLRSKLKTKNLGPKASFIYKDELEFYLKRNYKFLTLKDYCKEVGLL